VRSEEEEEGERGEGEGEGEGEGGEEGEDTGSKGFNTLLPARPPANREGICAMIPAGRRTMATARRARRSDSSGSRVR